MEKYDHIKSPCVDVIKNAEGEFIQVWDAPFKTPNRNLLFTYQRNGDQITSITRYECPKNGLYSTIIFYENQTTYYYRDPINKLRIEKPLKNGLTLIRDDVKGFRIEAVFTKRFNFEKLKPVGRKLGDRAVIKLQFEKKEYFVSTYQCSSEFGDQLALIEQRLGREVIKKWEFEFTRVN